MDIKTEYKKNGYVIIKNYTTQKKVEALRNLFTDTFEKNFSDNKSHNRNIIKRFSDTFEISRLFCDPEIENLIRKIGINLPIFCGPIVTHYTSNNETGNSYGLPFHQDWPSMASSNNSGIIWISLTDCNIETHSLEVVPRSHTLGLYDGEQMENGYVMKEQNFENSEILNINGGDILFMSSFLVHKTYVNKNHNGWKLSISRRYDDFYCNEWKIRGYDNAYKNTVDRDLYLKEHK